MIVHIGCGFEVFCQDWEIAALLMYGAIRNEERLGLDREGAWRWYAIPARYVTVPGFGFTSTLTALRTSRNQEHLCTP